MEPSPAASSSADTSNDRRDGAPPQQRPRARAQRELSSSVPEHLTGEASSTRGGVGSGGGVEPEKPTPLLEEQQQPPVIAASFYTLRNWRAPSEADEHLFFGEAAFANDDEHVFLAGEPETRLGSRRDSPGGEERADGDAKPDVAIFPPPKQTWLPRIEVRDARKLVDKLNAAAQLDVARDVDKDLALAERLTQEVVDEIMEVHSAAHSFNIPHFADGKNVFSIPVSVRVLNTPAALRKWGGINTAATNGRTIIVSEAIIANSWESYPPHFRRPRGDSHYALVILHEIGQIVRRRAPRLFDAANIDFSLFSHEVPADIYSLSFLRFADRAARVKASTST